MEKAAPCVLKFLSEGKAPQEAKRSIITIFAVFFAAIVHKMLSKWDGNWNEDITMWMAPGAPAQKIKLPVQIQIR